MEYWEQRHRREDDLRSGGDIGLDSAANEAFYTIRAGKLLELIGDANDRAAPLFVLDAGCGKGYFSEYLARCGHRVLGVDSSAAAVEQARAAGGARYQVSTLSGFSSTWLFDVVCCIDVLFHLTEDEEWERSLRTLATHVQLAGKLIVTDLLVERPDVRGNYIVHRPLAAYHSRLERWGLVHRAFHPYDFRLNQVGFHVFQRIG